MDEKLSYVYILSNPTLTTFYTGVTGDLGRRIFEHTNKLVEGFTAIYNVNILLYYEIHTDITYAIEREKKIKRWKREWKWNLIDGVNSKHENLYRNGLVMPL